MNFLHKGSTQLFFFVIDDESKRFLRQKSDEQIGKLQFISIDDIEYVHVHVSKKDEPSIIIESNEISWRIAPLQADDYEIYSCWVACLRYRSKQYSDELLQAHQKALKAAICIQSNFRRKIAMKKVLRRRKRRQGITNILASTVNAWLYGGDGYFDTDSEDEDEGDNKQRVKKEDEYVEGGDTSDGVFTSVVSAVMYDMYNQAFGIRKTVPEAAETRSEELPALSVASRSSMASFGTLRVGRSKSLRPSIQVKYLKKPANSDEVEDEIWENQKWEISSKSWKLLSFSDRLQLIRGLTPEDIMQYVTTDWIISQDFIVDKSGLNNSSCGKDGWTYGSSVRNLLMTHALGKPRIHPSSSTTLRRRRLFQRRRRRVVPEMNKNKVIWHGYLAIKTDLGRWQPYYFALLSGLVRGGKMTGITLVQFKHRVQNIQGYVTTTNMNVWDKLSTGKHIKIYQLEGARVYRGKKTKGSKNKEQKIVEYRKAKYSFYIKLTGFKDSTLKLACESSEVREEWVAWISYLVQQQNKNFTLTKIKVDNHKLVKNKAFDKIPLLKWSVLNRLINCDVDTFVNLVFFEEKFQKTLHLKLQARNFEIVHDWTDGNNANSRKQIKYILPKQKTKHSKHGVSVLPRTVVEQKLMINRFEPGVGLHLTSTLELPDVPFGKLMRCIVRTIVSKWKGKNSRVIISMEIDSQSSDERIKEYFESIMRAFMLQYYCEMWIPLCSKAIKYTLSKKNVTESVSIITPHGLSYKKV